MSNTPTRLTIDDAVLWLNDSLGETVQVHVDIGEMPAVPLATKGVLQLWHEREPGDRGWYAVGENVGLSLNGLDPFDAVLFEDKAIAIALSDEITLCIAKPNQAHTPKGDHQ
jgi:hypothetical protein